MPVFSLESELYLFGLFSPAQLVLIPFSRYTQSQVPRPIGVGTWYILLLKTQGIDDALIQPYSGYESWASLEIYSRLSLAEAQKEYDQVIGKFPIQ